MADFPADGRQPSILIMKKTTPLILIAGGLLALRLAAQNETASPAAGTRPARIRSGPALRAHPIRNIVRAAGARRRRWRP